MISNNYSDAQSQRVGGHNESVHNRVTPQQIELRRKQIEHEKFTVHATSTDTVDDVNHDQSTDAPSNGPLNQRRNCSGPDDTQAQHLIQIALDNEVDLFHTEEGDPHVSFPQSRGWDACRVDSYTFKQWLRYKYYEVYKGPPNQQVLKDAANTLAAKAQFEGREDKVHVRVAGHDDGKGRRIYIDLCNENREVIEVGEEGWRIMSDPPVHFLRSNGMESLPDPKSGGSLKLLRKYANVDDASFALLLAFLVQCWNDRKPYPIAGLFGEQGSGKSTLTKMLRHIVDPAAVSVRSQPKGERDLMISAQYSWLLAYDNSSKLSESISDALCRLATGSGFGTRTLYKNREEEIFRAARPVVINGIDEVIDRSDLADRSLFISLNPIPEGERRTERRIWQDFKNDRPYIIGALLDAVSMALAQLAEVELESMPRMADFAEWVVAAEPVLPIDDGAFMQAYQGNQEEAAKVILGRNPIALAIRDIIKEDENRCWEGTMEHLRMEIKTRLENPSRDFPKSAQAMTAELKRILPALRKMGIHRNDDIQHPKKRAFRLYVDK